jgi:Rab GDP dissociation inhibitor
MVSSAHNVCPKGYYIAIVSTIAENDANHHLELEPGFERLGKIEEKFMGPPIPLYEPIDNGEESNIFISKSYDATSHFETTTGKLLHNWRIYDLSANPFSQMMSVICTAVPLARS